MVKRGRKPKRRQQEEEDGQSFCSPTPTTAVRRNLHHPSPPSPSSPHPPPDSVFMPTRYFTRLAANGGANRAPLRSPVRNLRSTHPCVSSASSPLKNELPKNVDQLSATTSDSPDTQEEFAPSLNVTTTAAQSEASQQPAHQNESPSSSGISVNHTEIGERVATGDFDSEEFESNAEPALVTVSGYRVKEEIAPLLRKIIKKYGDIGKDCRYQTADSLTYHMEKVCKVYMDLEKKEATNFKPDVLDLMIKTVGDLREARINVEWVRERLDEIKKAYQASKEYYALKDVRANNSVVIERKKEELESMTAAQEKIEEELLVRKARMNKIFGRSFVRGLLD